MCHAAALAAAASAAAAALARVDSMRGDTDVPNDGPPMAASGKGGGMGLLPFFLPLLLLLLLSLLLLRYLEGWATPPDGRRCCSQPVNSEMPPSARVLACISPTSSPSAPSGSERVAAAGFGRRGCLLSTMP